MFGLVLHCFDGILASIYRNVCVFFSFQFQILWLTIAQFAEITLWICVSNVKQIKHQRLVTNVLWLGEFAM